MLDLIGFVFQTTVLIVLIFVLVMTLVTGIATLVITIQRYFHEMKSAARDREESW